MKNNFIALGGADEIGASCYYLKIGKYSIIFDYGIRLTQINQYPEISFLSEFDIDLKSVQAILFSHAHLDHIGGVLGLDKALLEIPMFASRPTIDLSEIMLHDALNITKKRQEHDESLIYLKEKYYHHFLSNINSIEFNKSFSIPETDFICTAIPAGHILGACLYYLEASNYKILFTGDFCMHDQHTILGMKIEDLPKDVDLLIIESTYCYQPDYHHESIEKQRQSLLRSVSNVINRGGNALIPAFALGRAQEIGCYFSDIFEQGLIKPFVVILDGLVKPITSIYNQHKNFLRGRSKLRQTHAIYSNFVYPADDCLEPSRVTLMQNAPFCVVASSGMLSDDSKSSKYAELFCENPSNAIFFSGYLDEESPGYKLNSLVRSSNRNIIINNNNYSIDAEVSRFHLSAHASADEIKKVIEFVNPRNIILVHGDVRNKCDVDFLSFLKKLETNNIRVFLPSNGINIEWN